MTDTTRPIGATPITDAAAINAPEDPRNVASNADLHIDEGDHRRDAEIAANDDDEQARKRQQLHRSGPDSEGQVQNPQR